MEDIITLISSVGFPIVCCGYMALYMNKTLIEVDESIKANTIIIEKLLTKLDLDDEIER